MLANNWTRTAKALSLARARPISVVDLKAFSLLTLLLCSNYLCYSRARPDQRLLRGMSCKTRAVRVHAACKEEDEGSV